MLRRVKSYPCVALALLASFVSLARLPAQDGTGAPRAAAAASTSPTKEDKSDPVARIRDEGLNRSQVMATLSQLTDVFGPRVTGSPGLRRASEWSREKFATWGMVNAHLEPWGPFGRGWELRRFSAQVVAPHAIPLIAYPKAWSPGLPGGALETDVMHVDIKKAEDFEKYRGKLRGKIVLDGAVQEIKLKFEPLARRRDEANLLALANSGEGPATASRSASTAPNPLASPEQRAAAALLPRKYQFFAQEGVAVLLQPSRLGEAGNLFTQGATVYPAQPDTAKSGAPKKKSTTQTAEKGPPSAPIRNVSPWKTDAPPIIPQVTVAAEHYNRLVRMIQQGESLRVAVELKADYLSDELMAANVIAEIPGSDLGEEIVMLGAHLDSWQSGTGATDNAAGSAVVLEAMRILRTLDLTPRRTIRAALWTGEEQGLLGSKAYVTEHFGALKSAGAPEQPDTYSAPMRGPVRPIEKKADYGRLSVYFNLDNGGGRIRGVYLQNNEAARPIFREWLKPFRDLGAETLALGSTGGTDHLSFDAINLPAFGFIQDELEYNTRTHHGNMDVYDRVIGDDLKQAAVIMATFVYQAAMRDEKIPQKPLPAAAAAKVATAAGQ